MAVAPVAPAAEVLLFGTTQDVISRNIRQLRAAGATERQALRAAYEQARRSGHRRRAGRRA